MPIIWDSWPFGFQWAWAIPLARLWHPQHSKAQTSSAPHLLPSLVAISWFWCLQHAVFITTESLLAFLQYSDLAAWCQASASNHDLFKSVIFMSETSNTWETLNITKFCFQLAVQAPMDHSFCVVTQRKHFPEDFCLNDDGLLLLTDDKILLGVSWEMVCNLMRT